MIKKKSIVLSGVENETQKAVLSLEEVDTGVQGTIRLYNFSCELGGVLSLGFYVNKQVIKAGLTRKGQMLYSFFSPLKEIPSDFSCAVINFENATAKPVLFGATGGKDDVYASIITSLQGNNSYENTKNVLDRYGVCFEDENKIEEEIDREVEKSCNKTCENCEYKKFYLEHTMATKESVEENLNDEKNDKIEEKEQKSVEIPHFYGKLKPQIDKLFEKYPLESSLQNIIPNSKWVKVDYENDGDYYVFGLIYDENGQVACVCYGVPAIKEDEPPKELSGYPVFLSLEEESDFGYYLTYQDASTGEPIKAVLD